MPVTATLYGNVYAKAFNKEIDLDSDTIKVALVTSTYTFSDAHDYFNDITNEVSGTGYTAGGATLASKSVTYTTANSWGTSRANSTAYTAGQFVRPASGNGFLYMATVGGTSAGSPPTFNTGFGSTTTDGGVTWACVGHGAFVFDAADTSWTTSTITARAAVIYDSTGTASTSPLIGLVDFGADVSTTAGTFAVTWDAQGILVLPVA